MINVINKESCCGCTACASVCPLDAISMQPDTLGFLYPVVNHDKCINCGLCDKVCAFKDNYDTDMTLPQPVAYAVRHNNNAEVETSRSGAAFIAISDYILENSGVVYGVGYVDHFRVAHKRATTKLQRDEFKGSKYVQSDLRGIFRQIKSDLCEGRTVLFSGTPCQTAGLSSYIGSHLRKNLILVDIVCHGVPGPYVWRDYISYIEKINQDVISYVNFRDKSKYGWSSHYETFKFKNREDQKKEYRIYSDLFNKCISFRYSCGACKFANLKRPSDLTIADFWGWEKAGITINEDDRGLSLVLCNTKKGGQIFDIIKDRTTSAEVELDKCLQPNLQSPTILHTARSTFESEYGQKGFDYVVKKYVVLTSNCRLRQMLRKLKIIWRKYFILKSYE